jgi:hypothetical protein
MFIHARLAPAVNRDQGTGVRTRVARLATAIQRALSDGIVCSLGISAAVLAALSALVCVTGCPAPTPANGAISVSWSIRAAGGAELTCDAVRGRFVALHIRNRGSGAVIATAFPCADARGTAQLPAALYDVSFQLNAADGIPVATAPDQTAVSVTSGQTTPLAPVALQIDTSQRATLVLSIATGATTNCQPPAAGGAGITGSTITLEHAGGCAAVTFTRQRGTEPHGTYTVDCSNPTVGVCIEKTETLTTTLAPGSYLVHARGKLGALDCWARDDTLNVPIAGGTVSRTLGLVHVTGNGCPP